MRQSAGQKDRAKESKRLLIPLETVSLVVDRFRGLSERRESRAVFGKNQTSSHTRELEGPFKPTVRAEPVAKACNQEAK